MLLFNAKNAVICVDYGGEMPFKSDWNMGFLGNGGVKTGSQYCFKVVLDFR